MHPNDRRIDEDQGNPGPLTEYAGVPDTDLAIEEIATERAALDLLEQM